MVMLTSYYNRRPLEMWASCQLDHPARRAWVGIIEQLGFRPRLVNGLRVPWEYAATFEDEGRFDRAERIAVLAGEFFFGDAFQKCFQA